MTRTPGVGGIQTGLLWIAAAGMGVGLIAQAQVPAARPQFEVASIKPSAGGSRSSMGMGRPGNFEATNMSLKSLIAEAYHVKTFEVYGGPRWVDSDTYDITAKPTLDPKPGATSKEAYANLQLMLQTLLEDRYALKVHHETKELPVYALVIAKGGLKMQPSDCVKADANPPATPPAPGQAQPAFCGNTRVSRNGQNMVMTGTGITMAALVRILSNVTNRTVIDRSGYTQPFNATLEWAADQGAANAPVAEVEGAESTGASLFTALQEQLGLRFDSTKGPVDVLVIDTAEKPTPN